MNSQALRAALVPTQGTLKLTRNTLTPGVDAFLDTHYQGQPIVISDAAPGPGDGVDDAVVFTGRSSFLGVADVPVTARFSVDSDGQVRALLRYTLRESQPGPAAWTFSRSFPKLPTVWNYATGFPTDDAPVDVSAQQKPYVDALDLYDTYYAVSTHDRRDPELDVPLESGVNVVSRMRPQGMAGVLEAALDGAKPLTLYGPVRIPKPTERTQALTQWQTVWQRPDAPGLHLTVPLSLDFKVGKLSFQDAALNIYSPLSTEWQSSNPTFTPTHGYTGRLSIASAGINVDLSADLEWGLPKAFLFARCKGLTLGKLTELADLTGTDGLSSALPDALKGPVDALEKLELIDLGISLTTSGATPTVNSIAVNVGMPGLVWKIWDDNLQVEGLSCRFRVQNPFGGVKSKVAVTLMGTVRVEGVPISIIAERGFEKEFTLYGRVDGLTLPLGTLMKRYVPNVPPPADLTVNHLGITVSPGRFFSMSTALAGKPQPWVIPVGRSNITIGDVSFDVTIPKAGNVAGSFAGTASLGKSLSLSARYTIPGNFALRGDFYDIKLRKLIDELCDLTGAMPADFDLTFTSASVIVQKRGSDYVFQLATDVKGVGLFALEVGKTGGKWGFSGGMDLGAAKLSSLPGLGGLKPIEDFAQLKKLMLMISTHDNPGFQFPDMAQFNAPQLATGKLALPAQTSVTQGFMAFAEWQLDPNSREQGLLMKLLGLGGTQRVTVAVSQNPAASSRFFFAQQSKINGLPFNYQLGVMLTNGKPSFFLTGSLVAKIQGQPQTFDVTTAFVSGGAFLSATMKGATAVDCGPFKLSNLALQVGVNWGGIPSLGIAATIDVKKFTSSVAVFFDSTDPSRSLVAGSISSLTAKDVMDTLVGGLATPIDEVLKGIAIKGTHEFTLPGDLTDELDELVFDKVSAAFAGAKVTIPSSSQQLSLVPRSKGSSWHLTDLTKMRHYELEKKGDRIQARISPQFYFAPQPTSIGTIKFPQAFYLNAAISFAGFDAAATVDIAPNKGLSIDAQMDKLVLLDEKLFSLTALEGGGGPKISVSTFRQPENPVKEFREPHFYINGAMTLLGVKRGLYASVTTQGVDFELTGNLVPGVHFDVDARFGKAGLSANGKAKVGVGTIDLGALGKAKINTDLEVELELDIDVGAKSVSLPQGTEFPADTTLLANELATFVFQGDGNLVLYKTSGVKWEPVWASNTAGRGGKRVAFQGDGNFVIYTAQGPIWASNSNGPGASKLTLRDNGNVVLTDASGNTRWQTGTNLGGAGAYVEMESSFTFAGQDMKIAKFRIDAKADTFTKLPDIVAKKVEEALNEVFKDATKWANAVANGVMDGVNDTTKVFKDVYKKSEQEAKALANSMNKGAQNVVNDVAKGTQNVVKDAGNVAKDAGKDISKGVQSVGKSAEKTAKKTYKKMKFW